ncbi:MAG: hypothetical protein CVU09_00160 [Bacteroidetes bacterium HGW-Bacteroidetes-4]|nr:MAG: hypothetical protein CVU09_00160 [Bacteroidetes bacterium HGW-Bacteroidetes-4]
MTFITNKDGIFNPTINTSDSSVPIWRVEGYGVQAANTPSFDLTGNTQDLKVTVSLSNFSKVSSIVFSSQNIKGTLDMSLLESCTNFQLHSNSELIQVINPTHDKNVNYYSIQECNITGTLDISTFQNIGGSITFNNNPNLTQIINPVSSSYILTNYNGYLCDLTGTLDMTGFTLGGYFRVYSNPNLTGISHAPTSEDILAYQAHACNLTGTLDLSGLTGFGGGFLIYQNPNLTQIINPVSSNNISTYYASDCNLTGMLDLSGLTGLGGLFRVNGNPNLTQIINPVSSNTFTYYYASSCNLTGTLDLSGLTGLGGDLRVHINPNLTQIINPVSSKTFTYYYANQCNLTGTLDLSGLTGFGGTLAVYINPNLTSITLPIISNKINVFYAFSTGIGIIDWSKLTGSNDGINIRVDSCAFTAVESDQNTYDIEAMGWANGTLNVGGTNAALTDGAITGYDGITAKNDLITAGWTVTYN